MSVHEIFLHDTFVRDFSDAIIFGIFGEADKAVMTGALQRSRVEGMTGAVQRDVRFCDRDIVGACSDLERIVTRFERSRSSWTSWCSLPNLARSRTPKCS